VQIVVTGSDGFIGKNLRVRLAELGYADVETVTRATSEAHLRDALARADVVYHLAGANRPPDPAEFDRVNAGFTGTICSLLRAAERRARIVYASSAQAALDNPYGRSKRAGEAEIERYARDTGAEGLVLRLPNVFGKWSRPNHNSAIATFCHNIARGLPITVHNPTTPLRLAYVDDVVSTLLQFLEGARANASEVQPIYESTVGEVSEIISSFPATRRTLTVPAAGEGLTRALYATYVSFLPPAAFHYGVPRHSDPRGVFVEMLRTKDSGQASFFTALPGATRGEHYHHTKTEKFLVIKGAARFGFRHLLTGEMHEIHVGGEESKIVETVPGWAHDVTNVGADELIVMLWANEVFDPEHPDTIRAWVRQ
jgi:UDP-2-acetamido-2,6-beta-L-arabino-hexul-4-ose reductase